LGTGAHHQSLIDKLMRGDIMRGLIFCLVLLPSFAFAEKRDTSIQVEFVQRSMRVRPSPTVKHGRVTINVILHPDGTVEEFQAEHGPHARVLPSDAKHLGASYKVLNDHTIQRVYHVDDLTQTVTISVNGSSCSAGVELAMAAGKHEFRAYSTELGTDAYYTDATVEKVSCSIK
jgi:hypothetical protein